MNLREICKEIARCHKNITAYRAETVLQSFLDIVEDELRNGGNICLRRFGKIEVRTRRWTYKRKKRFWFDEKVEGCSVIPHVKVSRHLKNLFGKVQGEK